MTRKRRYGRLQKAMGDVSLLAGSPTDAIEHYTTAIDLSKACGDVVWTGAAIAGVASAKVGSRLHSPLIEYDEDQPTQMLNMMV